MLLMVSHCDREVALGAGPYLTTPDCSLLDVPDHLHCLSNRLRLAAQIFEDENN